MDISIVVPVRDEAASVAALLQRLAGQTRAAREIVVVDGGSTDGTPQVVAAFAAEHTGANVRLVHAGPATPGRGRNVGVVEAAFEWIAFTDAGIDVDAHWLDRLARVAESDPAVDVVYGAYEPVVDSRMAETAALAYVGPKQSSPVGPVRTRSIASCLLRRKVWEQVGGFPDLRAAEDRLFMAAVEAGGFVVAVAPEAVVRWHLQPTLRRTFDRFRVYSRHNVLAGQQANWHRRVLRYYLIGGGFVLGAVLRWRPLLAVPLGGFVTRAVRSSWTRRDGRSPAWALQPVRVARVAGLLAVVDIATFAGWVEAIAERRRRDG